MYKLENHKEYFSSKEHYLEFVKSWKAFINTGHAKKKIIPYGYTKSDGVFCPYTDVFGKPIVLHESELDAKYHLVYALLRGKDIRKTFPKPVTENKIENNKFKNYIVPSAIGRNASMLKLPFGDTLTPEMISKLKVDLEKITYP